MVVVLKQFFAFGRNMIKILESEKTFALGTGGKKFFFIKIRDKFVGFPGRY